MKARERAKKVNREFTITLADLETLWLRQEGRCALTGAPLALLATDAGEHFSVDRIRNQHGYTPDNVQLVTTWANMAKGTLSEQDFLAACRSVVTHLEAKHGRD